MENKLYNEQGQVVTNPMKAFAESLLSYKNYGRKDSLVHLLLVGEPTIYTGIGQLDYLGEDDVVFVTCDELKGLYALSHLRDQLEVPQQLTVHHEKNTIQVDQYDFKEEIPTTLEAIVAMLESSGYYFDTDSLRYKKATA